MLFGSAYQDYRLVVPNDGFGGYIYRAGQNLKSLCFFSHLCFVAINRFRWLVPPNSFFSVKMLDGRSLKFHHRYFEYSWFGLG